MANPCASDFYPKISYCLVPTHDSQKVLTYGKVPLVGVKKSYIQIVGSLEPSFQLGENGILPLAHGDMMSLFVSMEDAWYQGIATWHTHIQVSFNLFHLAVGMWQNTQ